MREAICELSFEIWLVKTGENSVLSIWLGLAIKVLLSLSIGD